MAKKGGRQQRSRRRPGPRNTRLFLTKLDRFLRMMSGKVRHLGASEFEVPQWKDAAAGSLEALRGLIPSARQALGRMSDREQDLADQAIGNLGLLTMIDTFQAILRRGSPVKTALSILGSFIIALGDFVGGFPGDAARLWGGIIKAIGRALVDSSFFITDNAIQKLEQKLDFVMDLPAGGEIPRPPEEGTRPVSLTEIKEEIREVEAKLHFVMDLPAGEAPPPAPPAGSAPVSLTLLKQKLDNLADRLGEILVGARIPIEPGETIARPPHPIKAELQDLERKLDFIMDRPEGAPIPPPPPAGTAPVSLTEIKQELGRIERKLHFIMDLPPDMPIPPVPPGVTPVSLTQLEKKLDFIMDLPAGTPIPPVPPGVTPVSLTQIQKKLDFIMDLPPGMPIPPVPPGVMPVSLTQIDRKLGAVKRIFVAEEGVFAAASTAEARAIAITAPAGVPRAAFDLGGWIDLREMRSGDVVRVRLDAAVAGRGPLTFAETSFTGLQAKPLKHFRDFADGVEAVVGTSVTLTLEQPVSADNFQTPVTVGYQFVVESP